MSYKFKYLMAGMLPLFFYFALSLVWTIPFVFQSHGLLTSVKVFIGIIFLSFWAITAYELEKDESLTFLDFGLAHLIGFVLIILAFIFPMNSISEKYYITLNNALFPHQPTPSTMIVCFIIMLFVFVFASNAAKRKKTPSP